MASGSNCPPSFHQTYCQQKAAHRRWLGDDAAQRFNCRGTRVAAVICGEGIKIQCVDGPVIVEVAVAPERISAVPKMSGQYIKICGVHLTIQVRIAAEGVLQVEDGVSGIIFVADGRFLCLHLVGGNHGGGGAVDAGASPGTVGEAATKLADDRGKRRGTGVVDCYSAGDIQGAGVGE